MATERSSPARRPGATKPPAFADAPVNPQTDSPFAPTSNPTTPAIPTVAPGPARPVVRANAPAAPAPQPVHQPVPLAVATAPAPVLPAQGSPAAPPPLAPPPAAAPGGLAATPTGLIPPPLPMTAPVPSGMPPPLPLSEQYSPTDAVAAPAAPAKTKKRGRGGAQRSGSAAPQPQAVDPALLAAYREFSEDVRPSDAEGVYFPDLASEEQAVESPKGRGRRRDDDLMPRGRGRAPATGKGPFVLAGVAAVGLGTAFAVVLSGHHGAGTTASVASHAVHVDATAADASTSITVPASATRGPSYTLKVPAGFVADSGNDSGSDVLLSEPVLDLHLRVQSRTKDSGVTPPTGTPASLSIAGATAKGTESTARGHAVRTVQFVRDGVTYTVTETVPAEGKAHTFKVLDQVLAAWSFRA